jgi:arginine repressor
MDIRTASKMMLEKKYKELEELQEEIEVYEFIVNDPTVAKQLDDILNATRYLDGEAVNGREYVELPPEHAQTIVESNKIEIRSRIEQEMWDVFRESYQGSQQRVERSEA